MSKETLFAVLINFLLYTPLAVLFTVGTRIIVEQVVLRQTSSLGLLGIGMGIEFCITYWQVSRNVL